MVGHDSREQVEPGIEVEPDIELGPTIDLRRGSGAGVEVRPAIDLRRGVEVRPGPGTELDRYRVARLLTAEPEVLSARRLQAEVFLASGYIRAQDLAADGTIDVRVDPWAADSTCFAVIRRGTAVATARQIGLDDARRLPALRLPGLDPDPARRLRELPPGTAVEISGLARRPDAARSDVVAVYVRMWQESLARGHRAWVMAVDLRVFEMLRDLLCGRAIRRIGPAQDYWGSAVVPAVIWCDELNPEQRRMARLAGAADPFRSLLPDLFEHPAGAPGATR